jgi:hypothetical protein
MEFAVLWDMSPCCLAAEFQMNPLSLSSAYLVRVTWRWWEAVSVPHYTPPPTLVVTTTVDYRTGVQAMGQGSVADLLSRRPGFDCRAVYVTAVVDKIEMGQVILRVHLFSPVLPLPYTCFLPSCHYPTPILSRPAITLHLSSPVLPLPYTSFLPSCHYPTPVYSRPAITLHLFSLVLPLPYTFILKSCH